MNGMSLKWMLGLVYGAALALGLIAGIAHATHGEVGPLAAFLLGFGGAGIGSLIGMGVDRR